MRYNRQQVEEFKERAAVKAYRRGRRGRLWSFVFGVIFGVIGLAALQNYGDDGLRLLNDYRARSTASPAADPLPPGSLTTQPGDDDRQFDASTTNDAN